MTLSAGDYIYHQPISVTGNTGILASTSGHYTSQSITLGLNLKDNYDFQNIIARMLKLENEVCLLKDRLHFIESNPQLEEKFESLKRAGEEYRLIEKLVYGPAGERNGTS